MTPELMISCEVVFQEHKTSTHPIAWNKDAFRGRMSIGLCEMAKETLVQKKVIYFPKPAKRTMTLLNPVVATAETFEDAVAMIQNNPPSVTTSIEQPRYTEASVSGFTSYSHVQLSKLTSNSGNPGIAMVAERWYLRPFFVYVVWPASALVVSVLIAYAMCEWVEMAWR